MRISDRFKFLTVVSLVLLGTLLILTFIKKKVHVTGTLELSRVSFAVQNNVPNFLGVNNTETGLKKLYASAFSKAVLPYQQLETTFGEVLDSMAGELIVFPEDDYTASLRLELVNIGDIGLSSGDKIHINALKDYDNRIKLDFESYSSQIELFGESNFMSVKLRDAYGTYLSDKETDKELYLNLEGSEIISITPTAKAMCLTMEFKENENLQEEDVLVTKAFQTMYSDGKKMRSGVLNGSIHIEETNKSVSFGRNKTVLFDSTAVIEITDLAVYGDKIKVVFETYTDELTIGDTPNHYIPHMLEYLSNNNFLVIIFNSYMALLALFISLRKGNKSSLAEESKKDNSKI